MARNPEIVIIDPSHDARDDLTRMLDAAQFTVVGDSDYGIEAVSVAKEHDADVFLISMEEPVARAIQTIEMLGAASPNAAIIVYSSQDDATSVRRVLGGAGVGCLSCSTIRLSH